MQKLYYLYHIRNENIDDEDIKTFGIYTSNELTEKAKDRVKNKPSVIDFLDGFHINKYNVDKDYWVDGFTE